MKLVQLIVKNLNGTISEEEVKLFNEWLRKSKRNKELYSRLQALCNKGVDVSDLEILDSEAAWSNVVQKYESSRNTKHRLFIFKPILRYAAIFIGLIALGYGCYEYTMSNNQTLEQDSDVITLQLDNGEIRILSTDDTHAITDAQGNVLGKKEGSKLDYKDTKAEGKLVYNTLTIPYGKRFEIALSDGTTVHLNAGSSLRYPVKFINGKKRQVFLEGEAFFDVSEDKEHPFIVSAPGMDVTVLGTEFNVTAYPEDTFINTVLVEGSVGLSNTNDEQSNTFVRLEPGYKAEWKISSGKAKVEQVDTEMYTSWISGRLMLKNLSFENIIKKLERHYNVKMENNFTELNSQVFTASFDVETIDEVLGTFSENKKFNFEINNNTVTINKP
jgi:ferric-dicitrate binding protein FerR (iron transport regulator)